MPRCPRPTTRRVSRTHAPGNGWTAKGITRARRAGKGDRTVVIPPPNVTGMLHMGHALDDTIQDTYIRYSRMNGYSTRWILGTDHAGIATQTKVDKKLKSEGVSRLEIGREAFLDECQKWRDEYGGIIVEQIKRMGCSIDFDDEKFTMSPEYARAVRKVFCDWYPRRSHLPGQAHRQLVPELHDGHLRMTRRNTRTRKAICGTCAIRSWAR